MTLDNLNLRIERLKQDHRPKGDSQYVNVTGNMLLALRLAAQVGLDNVHIKAERDALDSYLGRMEEDPVTRTMEMGESRGACPREWDEFLRTPGLYTSPHAAYAFHVASSIGCRI